MLPPPFCDQNQHLHPLQGSEPAHLNKARNQAISEQGWLPAISCRSITPFPALAPSVCHISVMALCDSVQPRKLPQFP